MDITPEMLTQLNTFTRRELTADEVYIFRVRLCDNEIDRDRERFSIEALEEMKELFVGKTGVFDHNPSGEKQSARIFMTEIAVDESVITKAGEPYTSLCAYAYMVRTEGNADLIREIDGGIKKEVSVSVSAGSHVCSICGKEKRISPCTHMAGQEYGGKICHTVLSQILDAYEWSFVAVPAQRNAGVTKHYSEEKQANTDKDFQLEHCKKLLSDVEERTRREVMQLQFCTGGAVGKAFRRITSKMDLEELLQFKDELLTQQESLGTSQLLSASKNAGSDSLSSFCTR